MYPFRASLASHDRISKKAETSFFDRDKVKWVKWESEAVVGLSHCAPCSSTSTSAVHRNKTTLRLSWSTILVHTHPRAIYPTLLFSFQQPLAPFFFTSLPSLSSATSRQVQCIEMRIQQIACVRTLACRRSRPWPGKMQSRLKRRRFITPPQSRASSAWWIEKCVGG